MQHGDHRKLIVWQKAMDLVDAIYDLTSQFPLEEIYVLTAQMRRCAISIPSNIAEGRRRGSDKEFQQFLRIAFGSGSELETQLEIAHRRKYGSSERIDSAFALSEEVMKMLNSLLS